MSCCTTSKQNDVYRALLRRNAQSSSPHKPDRKWNSTVSIFPTLKTSTNGPAAVTTSIGTELPFALDVAAETGKTIVGPSTRRLKSDNMAMGQGRKIETFEVEQPSTTRERPAMWRASPGRSQRERKGPVSPVGSSSSSSSGPTSSSDPVPSCPRQAPPPLPSSLIVSTSPYDMAPRREAEEVVSDPRDYMLGTASGARTWPARTQANKGKPGMESDPVSFLLPEAPGLRAGGPGGKGPLFRRLKVDYPGMLDTVVTVTVEDPGPLYVRLKPDPRGLVVVNNFEQVPDDPVTGCPRLGPVEAAGTVVPGDALVCSPLQCTTPFIFFFFPVLIFLFLRG
ncbi:unnamed protein product [Discosporangium mesarthrocarpum]